MVIEHAPRTLTPAMYRQVFIEKLLSIGGDMRALWIPNAGDTTTTADETRHGQTWTYEDTGLGDFDSSPSRIGNGIEVVFNGTSEEADTGDNARYTFGDGAVDQAFSVFAVVRVTAGAGFQMILAKLDATTGSTEGEWAFGIDSSERPQLSSYDDSASLGRIGRRDATALTTNTRYFLAATYDGTGLALGVRVYVNAVRVDDTDNSSGSYTAMEDKGGAVMLAHSITSEGVAGNFWTGRIALAGLCAKELNVHEIWQMKEAINSHYDLSL